MAPSSVREQLILCGSAGAGGGGREAGNVAGDIGGDPLCPTRKVDRTPLTMCNLQGFEWSNMMRFPGASVTHGWV